MSFSRELREFRRRTLEKYERVKRMSAFDLFSAIVMETPVDKGTLRANWFVTIGRPSRATSDEQDESGQSTVQRINQELNRGNMESDVFLTNNLPYSVPIEFDGHSGKAPLGMVRVNTLRWKRIVSGNVRRVRNGV